MVVLTSGPNYYGDFAEHDVCPGRPVILTGLPDSFHGFSWVLMDFHRSSWLFMIFYGFPSLIEKFWCEKFRPFDVTMGVKKVKIRHFIENDEYLTHFMGARLDSEPNDLIIFILILVGHGPHEKIHRIHRNHSSRGLIQSFT